MTKIAYNACYGGFSLSEKAILRLKELGVEYKTDYDFDCMKRHDPRLIQVIEELGEEASGGCAELEICEIEGKLYRISEYDKMESVETPDTTEWEIAE